MHNHNPSSYLTTTSSLYSRLSWPTSSTFKFSTHSRCPFMSLLSNFLSPAQGSSCHGQSWSRRKARVLCCHPAHGAISCRELPSHSQQSQVVLLTLREPLWKRKALWSSLGLANHAEQHTDTRQWERRAGRVNAKRDVSKHKVIKYSSQETEESLWELARQTKGGQLSCLFGNWWADIDTFRFHSIPSKISS